MSAEWDTNAIQRESALRGPLSRTLHATPPQSASEPMVPVLIGREVVQLSEQALCAGLSHLRLSTGERVGLRDYAEGVGLVLAALEKSGVVVLSV